VAKLVSTNQRIATGVMNPTSVYSRVVSCAAYIKAPSTQGYGFTASVGNVVWLHSIRVWMNPYEWAATDWCQFKILQGSSKPGSYAEILNWENILPILYQGNQWGWWVRYKTFALYEWTMQQLFTGKEIKFGVAVEVSPAVNVMWLLVSFEISEG